VTGASRVIATRPAIADLIVAVPFVVPVQLADLIVALAFVLAFRLRNVASIRTARAEQQNDRRAN
jgi:hypothetical protein